MCHIDLLIIGAGPAGLMTASTAAKLGLKVVVVEIKKDITKITRSCSAQFVLDEGYEGETIRLENNKIIFTKNQFEVPYTGRTINVTSVNLYSPSGYRVHFAHEDKRPSAIKFDKGDLLRGLKAQCETLGVELRFDTFALEGKDLGDKVSIKVKHQGEVEEIIAKKLVIAEGVNAKLTGQFGLNEGRQLFGMPQVASYNLTNTKGFEKQSWNQFYGNVYHPFAEIMVGTSLASEDAVELTVMGTKDLRPDVLFQKLVEDSPLSEALKEAKIISKTGCSVKSYAPLSKPWKGNVLAIGDSAAHVEVIVQGALMCGYRAAQAVVSELAGENGFENYANWWKESFEFNRMEGPKFVKLYGALSVKANFQDDEIDYLFSLLEGKRLEGNFSQFEVPKTLWRNLLTYKAQIAKERPELLKKLKPIEALQAQGLI